MDDTSIKFANDLLDKLHKNMDKKPEEREIDVLKSSIEANQLILARMKDDTPLYKLATLKLRADMDKLPLEVYKNCQDFLAKILNDNPVVTAFEFILDKDKKKLEYIERNRNGK